MDIGVTGGGLLHLFKHLFTLRVVIGRASSQYKLAVPIPLHHPVRLYDPHRVFPRVETGDLKEDRLLLRHIEPLKSLLFPRYFKTVEDLFYILQWEVHVFLSSRIY